MRGPTGKRAPGRIQHARSYQPPEPGLLPKPRGLCKSLEQLEWAKTEAQPPHLKNGSDPSTSDLTGLWGGSKEKMEIPRDLRCCELLK